MANCHFLDRANHVKAKSCTELDTVEDAIDKAVALLRKHPEHHHSVEIWRGAQRLCAMYSRASAPAGKFQFASPTA